MSRPDQSTIRNHLLRSLPADDFARVASHLEPRRLEAGQVLFRAGETCRDAWFLETRVGWLIAISPEGHRVESGLYGRDGFTPVGLVMGAPVSPYENVFQVPGEGWRIAADVLTAAAAESPSLRELLLRYAHALSIQTTTPRCRTRSIRSTSGSRAGC